MNILEELITSSTRRKILTLFLTNPDIKLHLREIARRIGENPSGVFQELKPLEKTGLLKSEKMANLKIYSTNKQHIIYKELASIIKKTSTTSGYQTRIVRKKERTRL